MMLLRLWPFNGKINVSSFLEKNQLSKIYLPIPHFTVLMLNTFIRHSTSVGV